MRITIDTKRDSAHEIKHAIQLIERLTGHQITNERPNEYGSYPSEPQQESSPAPSGGMFNMFDSGSTPSEPEEKVDPPKKVDLSQLEEY